MPLTDPTNEWYTTSQQSRITASPRRGVVLHHGATTSMDAIIAMETSGSRIVSSNRVCKDARLARVVSDDPSIRAWSLSDSYWDSVLSSCECANEAIEGWTISPSSHETIAQWVAYRAQQEGWWPTRTGDPTTWTVFGHREIYSIFGGSYATACPGGMNLDWITARAQQLLTVTIITRGTSMPSMIGTPKVGGGFRFILTDGRSRKRATEDQTEANDWTFALCGGMLPVATNTGSALEQQMKLHAYNWLDKQDWADYFAPDPAGGGAGYTPAQIATAVDAALKDDFAAAMTAISQVDEATLATFGLKRV